MPKLVSFLALPVLLAAIGYQFFTGPGTFVHDSLGIGRPVVGVNNHSCQKIPELPACEDMWLHQETGLLYLACSDVVGRLNWLPATDNLNADKAPETDYIAILDTRASGPITSRLTHVKTSGFNKPLYLHGLDVWQVASSDEDSKPTLRVFVNSHNPARDPQTGKLLDAHKVGANSTIEVFETTLGASTMRHIRTHAHPEIRTPNRPAATGPDSFLFTNDHRDKVGHARVLDIFLPRSNIGFCDTKGCHSAYQGLSFPNGIVRSAVNPKLFYVPSSSDARIRSFELQADNTLSLLDVIKAGYPMDNLSVDSKNNIYAAAFPRFFDVVGKHFKNPLTEVAPAAVIKVSLNKDDDRFYGKKYKVEKFFEDDGANAAGITVAVLDEKTNRLFLGGVMTPYSVVCQL